MARASIPRKRLAPNIKIRRARSHGGATRMGGLPAVRMAWDTLDVKSILNSKGFTKRGVPASSLVFAGVTKPMVGATSNRQAREGLERPSVHPFEPFKAKPDGCPIIDDTVICIVCRVSTRADQVTGVIDSDFPYRKALRQFQLARAG